MPDVTHLLNNPAMVHMASQLMSDPNVQNMMSQLMNSMVGNNQTGAQAFGNILQAGQQVDTIYLVNYEF